MWKYEKYFSDTSFYIELCYNNFTLGKQCPTPIQIYDYYVLTFTEECEQKMDLAGIFDLKVSMTTAEDGHYEIISFLFFRENKVWHFTSNLIWKNNNNKYRLLHSFKFPAVRRDILKHAIQICGINPSGSFLTDAIMMLTTVYTDQVLNQGYHISFNVCCNNKS